MVLMSSEVVSGRFFQERQAPHGEGINTSDAELKGGHRHRETVFAAGRLEAELVPDVVVVVSKEPEKEEA